MEKIKKLLVRLVIISLVIKILFWIFVSIYVPHSKFENDSYDYLNTGKVLMTRGEFATQDNSGTLIPNLFRTPGYPIFLGVLNNLLRIPLGGVLLIQIIMTVLAAIIIYKAAIKIDERIGILSAIILLFDPPILIFSLMLLTETLFLFLLALFIFVFIEYLKNKKTSALILSALILTMATYVRPIGYYLGLAVGAFIIYANVNNNIKKSILQGVCFLIIVYSLLGAWQVRNHIIFSQNTFSGIIQCDLTHQGLAHSYQRNNDPYTQGMKPFFYYINTTTRCLMSLLTRPGSFKYFHVYPLTVFGKIIGYPWIIFIMSGFIAGVVAMRKNIYYQFMLLNVLYFITTSIGGTMWNVGERFRVPMMPFIAILSAYGWISLFKKRSQATTVSSGS